MNESFQNHSTFGRGQRNLLLKNIQLRALWAFFFLNKIFKYLPPNYFVLLPLQYMFFNSIYKRQMALSMANNYMYCSIKKYMLAVGFHSVFFLRYFLFELFKVVQAYPI